MEMLSLILPYTQIKISEFIDHNDFNLDKNEWISSVNEQQKI